MLLLVIISKTNGWLSSTTCRDCLDECWLRDKRCDRTFCASRSAPHNIFSDLAELALLRFSIITNVIHSVAGRSAEAVPNFRESIQRLPSSSRPTSRLFLHLQQSAVTIWRSWINLTSWHWCWVCLDWDVFGKEVFNGRAFDFAELQHSSAGGTGRIAGFSLMY
jgi:hypothetical protein